MNASRHPTAEWSLILLLLGGFTAAPVTGADFEPGVAKVQGILGLAQFSKAGGAFTPLGPGMVLRPGDLVQTATGSAVDLYLGEIAGTVRLTEAATLLLDKLTVGGTNEPSGFDVQLSLRSGELLGLSKPVPKNSRFEIKFANGITQIFDGRFRADAGGRVVVLQGKAIVAHVPPGGDAAAHTLTAPPGVYFAPLEGVQPASKDLEREITKQMRAKLPRR
jgi:hypothetical protein